MKVYIGPHKGWFGPYQLADCICWWARKTPDEDGQLEKPRWVHHFGEWLAHGSIQPDPTPESPRKTFLDHQERPKTRLYRFLLWIHSRRRKRIKVRIDPWDAWSGDHTLALIALPLIQRIKETKLGVPFIHPEDFPEHLEVSDENSVEAWNHIVDEIVFALTSIVEGRERYNQRIDRGLVLFGKYFRNLWT